MVKTAGRANFSFSMVMAWRLREKSKGDTEILETFCHGYTKAFLTMRTSRQSVAAYSGVRH